LREQHLLAVGAEPRRRLALCRLSGRCSLRYLRSSAPPRHSFGRASPSVFHMAENGLGVDHSRPRLARFTARSDGVTQRVSPSHSSAQTRPGRHCATVPTIGRPRFLRFRLRSDTLTHLVSPSHRSAQTRPEGHAAARLLPPAKAMVPRNIRAIGWALFDRKFMAASLVETRHSAAGREMVSIGATECDLCHIRCEHHLKCRQTDGRRLRAPAKGASPTPPDFAAHSAWTDRSVATWHESSARYFLRRDGTSVTGACYADKSEMSHIRPTGGRSKAATAAKVSPLECRS
jgi:hypothetical protein